MTIARSWQLFPSDLTLEQQPLLIDFFEIQHGIGWYCPRCLAIYKWGIASAICFSFFKKPFPIKTIACSFFRENPAEDAADSPRPDDKIAQSGDIYNKFDFEE